MTKLPRLSGRECAKALEKAGFRFVRYSKGDHMVYRRENPFIKQPYPITMSLDTGTLRAIIRQAGLTVEEFIALL